MTNIHISFYKLDCITPDEIIKEDINPGFDHINVHMIFYIKMDGKFTRK